MAITNSISSVIKIIRGLINDQLRTDGRDSWSDTIDNIFTLTEDFVSSSTIAVFKNGVQLSVGNYTYNSSNNQVTVSVTVTKSDIFVIKYSYYKKYSDAELQGYIESVLSYFPLYQYKKTFFINDDSNIVAENEYDPTTEEIYFISLISSILIDPQNIKISIPDLNISAKRDKSDQDQIKEAFRNFKNFVGTIDFEEYINLSE